MMFCHVLRLIEPSDKDKIDVISWFGLRDVITAIYE
jgi:hypothetical protein